MSKLLIGLFVLVVGVGVGWYVLGGKSTQEGTSQQMPVPATTGVEEAVVITDEATTAGESMEKGGVMTKVTVAYTDSGYSPKEVTIKAGTAVVFVNQSSVGMWTASAVHPTHQLLPGFDQLKEVAKGGTYEYTFEKVGTWKYHNHLKATDFGSVVVTE